MEEQQDQNKMAAVDHGSPGMNKLFDGTSVVELANLHLGDLICLI